MTHMVASAVAAGGCSADSGSVVAVAGSAAAVGLAEVAWKNFVIGHFILQFLPFDNLAGLPHTGVADEAGAAEEPDFGNIGFAIDLKNHRS